MSFQGFSGYIALYCRAFQLKVVLRWGINFQFLQIFFIKCLYETLDYDLPFNYCRKKFLSENYIQDVTYLCSMGLVIFNYEMSKIISQWDIKENPFTNSYS